MRLAWVLGPFLLIASASSPRAATLRVPDEHTSIQSAIDIAAPGDTVLISCGTYHEHSIDVTTEVVVRGVGEERCVVIDAGEAGRVFTIWADAIVENLTLTNGVAPDTRGGAVRVISGHTILRSCRVSHCRGNVGGGVAIDQSASAELWGCDFRFNSDINYRGNGGAIHSASSQVLVVEDCEFLGNVVGEHGGAISLVRYLGTYDLSARIRESTFRGNYAPRGGAFGCREPGASVTFESCSFVDNEAHFASAIYTRSASASTVLRNCDVVGGRSASTGGAVVVYDQAAFSAIECRFEGNESPAEGGAIYAGLHARVALGDCVFASNHGHRGGAVHGYLATIDITSCRFESNTAASSGGAFYAQSPSPHEGARDRVTIRDSEFLSNHAEYNGGALDWGVAHGGLVQGSLFVGNRAEAAGGAVSGAPQSRFTNCTFYGNECPGQGAAFLVDTTGKLRIETTILAGNVGAPAIECEESSHGVELACVDIWGNASGDWVGCISGQANEAENLSVDPQFCDPQGGRFTLQSGSPVALPGSPVCGLIGAFPVGCGTVSVTPTTFGRIKAAYRDGGQP